MCQIESLALYGNLMKSEPAAREALLGLSLAKSEKGNLSIHASLQLKHFYHAEIRNAIDNPAFRSIALQAMLAKISQIDATLSSKVAVSFSKQV